MTNKRIDQEIIHKFPTYIQAAIRVATPLLPRNQGEAWLSLWTLQKHILSLVFGGIEPEVKSQKKLWWIEELIRLKNKEARHPLTQKLIKSLPSEIWGHSELEACLNGWIEILAKESHSWINQAELSRFTNISLGHSNILLSAILLGEIPKHQLKEFILGASDASLRIELLRDAGLMLRNGISFIPLSDLHHHQIISEDLLKLRHENQLNSWQQLAESQAQIAYEKAQKAKQWIEHIPPSEQKTQWLVLAVLNIQLNLLDELKKHHFACISQRLELSPRTSVWEILKARFL